jgi:hypothetical protein
MFSTITQNILTEELIIMRGIYPPSELRPLDDVH